MTTATKTRPLLTAEERRRLIAVRRLLDSLRWRAEDHGEHTDRGEGDLAYNALRADADIGEVLDVAAVLDR